MKKISFALLTFVFAVALAGCGNQPSSAVENVNTDGAVETGRIIDATNLNGQTVTTTPGDLIEIKLTGDNGKQYQWSFSSIDAADYILLKSHTNDNSDGAIGTSFTSNWLLKIQKAGNFNLQFDYAKAKQKPEKSFKLRIVSE